MGYTLGEAAKACGISKATLSKAVKSGKISVTKINERLFSIEASELHRVYPPVSKSGFDKQSETSVNTEISSQMMVLQVKLDAADKRISDLETDRDAWRAQATRLLTSTADNKTGFFRRFFSSN